MNQLVFADTAFSNLQQRLLESPDESCAVLLTSIGKGISKTSMLVRECYYPPNEAYIRRSGVAAVLRPSYVVEMTNLARLAGYGLVFVHTHPGSWGAPAFSEVDNHGEQQLQDFLSYRYPAALNGALVVSPDGFGARMLGTQQDIAVIRVGRNLRSSVHSSPIGNEEAFERQVRAFGSEGQRRLQSLRVGVIGLGGTGSAVVQQLALLGVGNFLLLDPDVVEASNLNRLFGASGNSVGQAKVDVALKNIISIRPAANVVALKETVLDVVTTRKLIDTDFFFCCTDSHGSRAVLSQFAYQYMVPGIDMGVGIATKQGEVTHISARVQMLAPGLPCLACTQLLNPDAVRWDFMPPESRRLDPYFVGAGEPQPSVVTINSVAASLATTMLLGAVAGVPVGARFQIYDGIRGTVRAIESKAQPACVVCSESGALARGDEWPLIGRLG